MSRITKKFMHFTIIMITAIVITCFLLLSLIFTKIYKHQEISYLNRQKSAILSAYIGGYPYRNSDITAILVNDTNNTIIWSTQNSPDTKDSNKGHSKRGDSCSSIKADDSSTVLTLPDGFDYIYVKRKTQFGSLYILKAKQTRDRSLNLVYIILGVIFLIGLLISLPLSFIFGRKFTKPVVLLNKKASNIASGDFSKDAAPFLDSQDEIYDLYLTMEEMRTQLEIKDRLQREFIANVSHDLRTPLSIIRNCNEAISDGLLDTTGTQDYSKRCIHQVDRLNSMVSDIMNLSKLQSGDFPLETQWVLLSDFFTPLISDISMVTGKKNISLEFKCPPELLKKSVLMDSSLLRRCIMNFITNAVNVSPDGSSIVLSILENDGDLILSVDDSGKGIPDDILPTIWDRYIKNSKSGGMGLGLAINREILTKHGFSHKAFNLHSGGARFSFAIPFKNIR